MKAKEIRELAIKWLMKAYPGSVVVPELSVADWGGASIDVAAITEKELIGIEIKGEGDSPARLPLQGAVYGRVATKMWLLPDESIRDRCVKHNPSAWGVLKIEGDKVVVEKHTWGRDKEAHEICLMCPYSMCGTLWKDELLKICRENKIGIHYKENNVSDITQKIVEALPAPKLREAMIKALRERKWKKTVYDTRPKDPESIKGGLFKSPNRPTQGGAL